VHIKTKPFCLLFLTITATSLFSLTNPTLGSSLNLTITPSKNQYYIGENVLLMGTLTLNQQPVQDALVALQIDNPKGEALTFRTLNTGVDPNQTFTAEILEVYPCDSSGTPKYYFQPGQYAGFKVIAKNNMAGSIHVIITISLYYSNAVPFDTFILFNGTIGGQKTKSVMTWPRPIPEYAVSGNATIYANIYTDIPRDNGYALAPEKSNSFIISTSSTPSPSSSTGNGNFNLTYPLKSLKWYIGNYTVYGFVFYYPNIASTQANFHVDLLGDLHRDGKIDMRDVAIVAKAFNTQPGDPNWNPNADLTGPEGVPDGKVDMRDVAVVAKAFGTEAILDP